MEAHSWYFPRLPAAHEIPRDVSVIIVSPWVRSPVQTPTLVARLPEAPTVEVGLCAYALLVELLMVPLCGVRPWC